MPTFQILALVLKVYNFSEADRIAVLFTNKLGKIRGLAKGVRKSKSRLSAVLDLLSLAKIQVYSKKNQSDFLIVTQGQLLNSFSKIKADLKTLGQAARWLELVDNLISERQELLGIFNLLVSALTLLENGLDVDKVGIWFEINLLSQLGYKPNFSTCQVCGIHTQETNYSLENNDITCKACKNNNNNILISQVHQIILEKMLRMKPSLMLKLTLHDQQIHDLKKLLAAIFNYHIGKDLKSNKFYNAIKELD